MSLSGNATDWLISPEGDGALELQTMMHDDETELPWYRQLELIFTVLLVVVAISAVYWHVSNLGEWAEESLKFVAAAAMETAEFNMAHTVAAQEGMTKTNSGVSAATKAVAGAGATAVLFAPRALISVGVSAKYRLHNFVDDMIETAESLSPMWRGIWMLGDIVILSLAMTVLMMIPGSFLLLLMAWTALIVKCQGGDTNDAALDLITGMILSADYMIRSDGTGLGTNSRQSIRVVNPLLASQDLEDGGRPVSKVANRDSGIGGNLLATPDHRDNTGAGGDILFAGQKSDKVTRDEARALHTMLRIQQEQYAKQPAEQIRMLRIQQEQYAKQQAEQIRLEQEREARMLFDEIDTDENGTLDVEELTELAKSVGVELTAKQADKAFTDLDTDGSGEIDFDEFVVFYDAHVKGEGELAGFTSFFGGFKMQLNGGAASADKSFATLGAGRSGQTAQGTSLRLSALKDGPGSMGQSVQGKTRSFGMRTYSSQSMRHKKNPNFPLHCV